MGYCLVMMLRFDQYHGILHYMCYFPAATSRKRELRQRDKEKKKKEKERKTNQTRHQRQAKKNAKNTEYR